MSNDIVIDYTPRPCFAPFHARSARFSSLVVHRRGGKTVACINDLGAKALFTPKPNARYAYIAPFYRQAKDVAWSYVKQFLEPVIAKVRESELRVELINGSWITLYGADNPDALRGLYLDGVILDEYGDCRPSLWGKVILPTLVNRKGWAVVIGTAKGKNHFYKMHRRLQSDPAAYTLTLPASKSGLISQVELEEIASQMTPEEYDQEMECSFDAALQGTYYASLIYDLDRRGQITPLEINPDSPVYAAIDLGYTDSTSIWFWQPRPDGLAIIDFEEHDSQPLSFYFRLLREKTDPKTGQPYQYKTIYVPHDAKARTLQTGRSTIEQFLAQDLPMELVPKLKVQQGIDAARLMLPKCWFHGHGSAMPSAPDPRAQRVEQGLESLRAYRRNFSEISQSFTNDPVHDWTSHAADAFRYAMIVADTSRNTSRQSGTAHPSKVGADLGFSLDDLYAFREERLGRNFNRREI